MKFQTLSGWIAVITASLPLLSRAQDTATPVPHWIWSQAQAEPEETLHFRKPFTVPADLKRALLIATADNTAQLYINGDRRSFKCVTWEKPVIEDVTDRLIKGGDNLIAARATNEGGPAGLLFFLTLENLGGQKTFIISDETWQFARQAEKGWFDLNYTPNQAKWSAATRLNAAGTEPRSQISPNFLASLENLRIPMATAVEEIKVAEGFRVELLYSVPKSEQGSWIAMCQDDRGRLIVSDQYGSLYRFPIPGLGQTLSSEDIEKIEVDIGGAQGLLYAFNSLYVVLNTGEHGGRGLYRLRDTDGDDRFDSKQLLRKFAEQGGEHGPHAVILGPEGKSIYVIIGNQTPVIDFDSSRVPRIWDEDLLLERPYGRGFMKGTPAPGGWIAKTDPDGKTWELIATGFRNQYDASFDRNGELFTYDADMEWDMNTPWYRPTRINFVPSGAEFGWRNGGGKWPAYYPDGLPAAVDIGPGSPTGTAFGFGAKFPKRYQDAFYALDWSYGKLYAVHLTPDGAGFRGAFEEFISAHPLPLTDILIGGEDGAMYFTIGGRRVQSGLYRVTYVGDEPLGDDLPAAITPEVEQRRLLESFHGRQDSEALDTAWPYLGSEDRWLRFAARIAVEHQPVESWRQRVLSEADPVTLTQGAIALARHGSPADRDALLNALNQIDFASLNASQATDLVRAYSLALIRLGPTDDRTAAALTAHLDPLLPSASPELNVELLQLLVYLQSPTAAEKGITLLKSAPSQEEQMALAKSLRHLKAGWTRDQRADFFRWFVQAAAYRGGASFSLFIADMKKTALANTPKAEKQALKAIIEAKPESSKPQFTLEPREFVKNWTVGDFDDVINVGLEGNRDFSNGRKMFGAATCFACHRFKQEGGAIGPDLTSVSGKFSPRDLLESIIDPSKEISDQYGSMIFTMLDGSQTTGRIMNLGGDRITVNVNMMDPNQTVNLDRKQLKGMKPSPYSMMPPALINTLSKDDVLDLLAYLLSAGDPDDPMFK